jgi:hypothetical protein
MQQSSLKSQPVLAASQEIPHIFIEHEVSLPYSQVPATCPYPQPTPPSPRKPSNFLKIHLNIILLLISYTVKYSQTSIRRHCFTPQSVTLHRWWRNVLLYNRNFDQPRSLVVRVSEYWSWYPWFDSWLCHGDFSLKGKFPTVTMVRVV